MSDEAFIEAGKRLGVKHSDFGGDWFVGWSPRNSSYCAEGPWDHWVDAAIRILQDDLTSLVRPEAHEAAKGLDVYDFYGETNRGLADVEIAQRFGEENED